MNTPSAALPSELWGCTATQLGELYASGEASPCEALESVLGRVEAINPILNAFCLVDPERARLDAKRSEKRWQLHTNLSPIDGVPTSIKDLILTKGWPTLRGSKTIDPAQPWEVDAPSVARLRAAGATLFGKTTTPEFGCKGETNSPMTGITRNPWDPTKTPGGSSGGTSAAISAGMGPLSIGTDGAGSIRIPAAFCGNFGFKPSFGRVPAFPLSPFGSVAHLGPHTMSVADAAAMLNVITQPDSRDWTSLAPHNIDFKQNLNQGVKGMRIAFSPTLGYAKNVHPEVAAAVRQAVQVFVDLGADVDEVDPGISDPLELSVGLWFLGSATIWSGLSAAQRELADPDFRDEALAGLTQTALEIQSLNQRRALLGAHMRGFMENYDLLITPSVSVPAFEARAAGTVPFDAQTFLAWTPFSYPFNLTQQPAASIPCGLTAATKHQPGLPIGLQLVGRMFDDATVLRAAAAYERVRPIIRPPLNSATTTIFT